MEDLHQGLYTEVAKDPVRLGPGPEPEVELELESEPEPEPEPEPVTRPP